MTNNYSMEELIEVVAWLTRRYTSNESTSVTYEVANQLMEAVIYCIEAEEQYTYRQETVPVLQEKKTAKEAYLSGCEKILLRVKEANSAYNSLITIFDAYGNEAYYDTVVKGLPAFFVHYDIWFSPQDAILTFDYPTILPVYQKKGIDAVEAFVEYVRLEQRFLGKIQREQVIAILKQYHEGHSSLFLNIASMVMRYLVASVLNKAAVDKQTITKEQIDDCLKDIITKYYEEDEKLYEYLKADIDDFIVEKTYLH